MMVGSSSAGRCVISAEEDAVFAALLGDARDRLAGRAETERAVGRRVAMRFLAHDQQRQRAVAPQRRNRRPCGSSTETTESTTSAGKPASCMMVIGLPFGGRRKSSRERLHHRVAADIGVVEHEGVARIVARGLDARDQAVILRPRRAVLELAHALVDQARRRRDAIGHRRVDGVAGEFAFVADEARVAARGRLAYAPWRAGSPRRGSPPPPRRRAGRGRRRRRSPRS